jgi:DNA-binding transcriptional MerR regulator
MERTWTITELAERATATLAAGPTVPGDQVNGRVRDMPNERLIRWYTTIGLVDPPLGRRGRIALYGRRHLLQLVAVKRRQAAGLTIAEIQVELAGAPDDILREIARLPDLVPEPDTDPVVAHRDRFWAAPPATTVPIPLPAQTARPTRSQQVEGGPAAPPAVVHGVRLAEGVTLLFDGGAAPGAEDLAALAAAARPVLDELHRRGLLAVSPAISPAVSPVLDGPPVHDLRPGSSP